MLIIAVVVVVVTVEIVDLKYSQDEEGRPSACRFISRNLGD